MTQIDPTTLSRSRNYFQLISTVVPRPIAWVTSLDAGGCVNLAPFSFFQGITSDPPTVMLSFGRRRNGRLKDTPSNILSSGEFVVNLVTRELAEAMVESSADDPPGESEAERLGLAVASSEKVAPPRLAVSPLSLECRLVRHLEVGKSLVIFGEVLLYHVDESVLDEQGLIDPARLGAVARLGGQLYATLGEIFEIPRPRGG